METTVDDLSCLFETVSFLKETRSEGIVMRDVAFDENSVIIGFSDSSWANASDCRSQFGTLTLLSSPDVLHKTVPAGILDWKSGRSQRVCRRTLAAEASAADESCDRGSFLNMFISEIVFNVPAHRVGPRLRHLHVVDAKSLYDCAVQENPNLADKRSLVNIRAIQEVVPASNLHWVPTHLQYADGLTKVSKELRSTFRDWLSRPIVVLTEQALRKENNISVKDSYVLASP